MKRIETECQACGATGLYSGFAEAPGCAVVCLKCNGTGCAVLSYEPFRIRKASKGIKTVQVSQGVSILGCGGVGRSISYSDFRNGQMP